MFFVVGAYDISESCGGCTVLHRLCDRLNVYYAEYRETPLCYLYNLANSSKPLLTRNGYKTPVLPSWMDAKNAIVIYPEVVTGNPLGSRHVVNWMLYFPGMNVDHTRLPGPSASVYNSSNLIACWASSYCADFDTNKYTVKPLRVVDYELDYFDNLPSSPIKRQGTITYEGKSKYFSPAAGMIICNSSRTVRGTPLSYSVAKRERIELFSRSSYFYSYDPATFRTVEAAMSGCVSVVDPVPNITKNEWIQSLGEEARYGIAYGMDDLPHAQRTVAKAKPYIEQLARKQTYVVRDFVRDCLVFFGDNK